MDSWSLVLFNYFNFFFPFYNMQTHPDADTGSSCELASVSSDTSPTLNFSSHKILMGSSRIRLCARHSSRKPSSCRWQMVFRDHDLGEGVAHCSWVPLLAALLRGQSQVTHVCVHTYTHTHAHACTHLIYAHSHTHSLTHMQRMHTLDPCTFTHEFIHMHTCAHIHVHTCTY